MSVGKIIGYIAAAILIFFGVLFIWSAFASNPQPGNIVIGLITVAIGFGIIWAVGRLGKRAETANQNVTLKVDLPANVNMDTLKCQSCGAALTPNDIKMVAGAPVVTCPYCHTTYQLTEEPKW